MYPQKLTRDEIVYYGLTIEEYDSPDIGAEYEPIEPQEDYSCH